VKLINKLEHLLAAQPELKASLNAIKYNLDGTNQPKMKRSKPMKITFGSKYGSRNAAHIKGQDCIYVNGKCCPKIYLTVGSTYIFDVEKQTKTNYKFMLTESSVGGPMATPLANSFVPTAQGTVMYTPSMNDPSVIYYQCQNYEMMGGLIMIRK